MPDNLQEQPTEEQRRGRRKPLSSLPPYPTFEAAAPQEPIAPPEKEFFGDLAKNAIPSVVNLAKGIFVDFPAYLVQRTREIAADPKDYVDAVKQIYDPENNDFEPLKRTYGQFWGHLTDRYRDKEGNFSFGSLADAFSQDPAGVTADATGLAALTGGGMKALGKLGRLRALETAGTALVGDVAAQKAGLIAKIDPILLSGRLAGKLLSGTLGRALGITPRVKRLNNLIANELASERGQNFRETQLLIEHGLTEPEKLQLRKALIPGKIEDINALTGGAKSAYELAQEIVKFAREPYIDELGIFKKTAGLRADIRRAAYFLSGDTSKESVRSAMALFREGRIKPTYFQMIALEHDLTPSLFERMNPGLKRQGSLNWLRKFKGTAQAYETDPIKVLARSNRQFHSLKGKIRALDLIQRDLQKTGEIRAISRATAIPKGWAVLPLEHISKYLKIEQRARGLTLERALAGKGPQATYDELIDTLLSKETLRDFKASKVVIVPEDVAAYVKRKWDLPHPFLQWYDDNLGVFKSLVTVFNPAYWINVPVANAVLGIFYGLGLREARLARAIGDVLPPESLGTLAADLISDNPSLFKTVRDKFGRGASKLDDILRGAAYVKTVSEETASHLRLAAQIGSTNEATVINALRRISRSPEQTARIEQRILRLQEQAALQVPEIRALQKRADLFHKRLQTQTFADQMAIDEARFAALQASLRVGEAKGALLDTLARTGRLEKAVPGLRQIREIADKGIVAANNITGSYWRMMPQEMSLARRLIPFYTYTKMITALAFRLPFLFPRQTFMWHQLAKMAQSLVWDPDTPEWVKQYAPVGTFSDGSLLMVRIGSLSAFAGLRTAQVGDANYPGIIDILQQNPLAKFVWDISGGIPRWSKKPVTPGERVVRLSDGTAYETQTDGTLRVVIPSVPVLRALWGVFPQTQIIDALLRPYVQTDRGWLLSPDPIRSPSGEVMYPIETWMGVARLLGLPRFSKVNMDELKMHQRRKIEAVRKAFARELRYADPPRRNAIIGILSQWDADQAIKQ